MQLEKMKRPISRSRLRRAVKKLERLGTPVEDGYINIKNEMSEPFIRATVILAEKSLRACKGWIKHDNILSVSINPDDSFSVWCPKCMESVWCSGKPNANYHHPVQGYGTDVEVATFPDLADAVEFANHIGTVVKFHGFDVTDNNLFFRAKYDGV